jgi:hypothetical protein
MILCADKIALAMELRDCGFRWKDVARMTGVKTIDQWVRQAIRYGMACCRPPVRWFDEKKVAMAILMRKQGIRWKVIAQKLNEDIDRLQRAVYRRNKK